MPPQYKPQEEVLRKSKNRACHHNIYHRTLYKNRSGHENPLLSIPAASPSLPGGLRMLESQPLSAGDRLWPRSPPTTPVAPGQSQSGTRLEEFHPASAEKAVWQTSRTVVEYRDTYHSWNPKWQGLSVMESHQSWRAL